VTLSLQGVAGAAEARIQIVDPHHGSALEAWQTMGKPDFPSREQQARLRKAAELGPPEIRALAGGNPLTLSLTLAPYSLVLVEITSPAAK